MRILVAVAGLLIGVMIGVALLLLNPVALTRPELTALPAPVRSLGWSASSFAGFEFTPRGLLGISNEREAARQFRDPAIRHARADVVTLASASGVPQALGVRLSSLARSNSLLRAELGVIADWNILWAGEGSLLLAGSENLWVPLRDGLWSAVRGRGFRLRDSYLLQPLPGIGPQVVAGSGTLGGARGSFRERYFPIAELPGDFTGRRELQIEIEIETATE